MPLACELTLPFPVSTNRLWIRARKGMRKSSEYVAWLMLAGIEARKQTITRVPGPYKLTLEAVRPDKRRRDLSNLVKSTEDFLQSIGVIEDDCMAEAIYMRWVTVGEGVHIRVEPAGVECQ